MADYKPVEQDLRDGPVKERRCTDILCTFIFSVFVAAMVVVGIFGFKNGNPDMVLYPYDSSGNQCGLSDTVTADYPYLYYVNPNENTKYTSCVKSCPKNYTDVVECYPNTWVTSCAFTVTTKDGSMYDYEPYQSSSVLGKACLPSAEEIGGKTEKFMDYIQSDQFTQYMTDIAVCWTMVLGVLGMAIVISIVYMIFVRYFVGCALWLSFAAIIGLFVLFGLFLDWSAKEYYGGAESTKTNTALRVVAILCYVVAGLSLLLIICMRKRIELAVAIMKSASLFIADVWESLLVPVVMFFISLLTITFWVIALVYLYSSGTVEKKEKYSAMAHIKFDQTLRNAFWFEFLGILWIDAFKVAMTEFIIACACCIWYFRAKKDESPVCTATKYGVFYHMGSMAFGSFILSLVILIKWILRIISEKIYKEAGGDSNAALKCCCSCLNCMVSCFERFVKFLNTQAYIRVAMSGENFCTAAQSAFTLVIENAARYTVLGGAGTILNFLGKVLITLLSAWLGYVIITHTDYYADQISSPIPPTIVFIIVCYLVASLFMSVYSMACESIIQAFLIDEKSNGSSVYAPEPLAEFMKENRQEKGRGCC